MKRIPVLAILLLAGSSAIESQSQTPRNPAGPTITVTCPEAVEPGKVVKGSCTAWIR